MHTRRPRIIRLIFVIAITVTFCFVSGEDDDENQPPFISVYIDGSDIDSYQKVKPVIQLNDPVAYSSVIDKIKQMKVY